LIWIDFLSPGVSHFSLFKYPILVVFRGNALLNDLVMILWNSEYDFCVSCEFVTSDQSVSCRMLVNLSLLAIV
jgi:hypothetical protein